MKFFACCLLVFVVGASNTVMGASLAQIQLRLEEIRMDLGKLNKSVQHNGLMLNTPQIDEIENCCSGSALQCFSEKLSEMKTTENAGLLKRFIRNIQKATIQKSVNTCSAENTKNAKCKACDSYTMRDSKEFIRALETLLQSSINQLALKA